MMKLYVTFLALSGLLVLASSCGDAAGKRLDSSTSKTTQFIQSSKTALSNFSQALSNISGSPTCAASGLPTAAAFSNAYNLQAIPCTLNTNTQNFNSVNGILTLFSGLMCAIEDQVDFNYNSAITTHTVTIDALDSCLTGVSLGGLANYTVTVKEQALTLSSWSYKISVDFTSGTYSGKRMYIFIRETGNTTGMKISLSGLGTPDAGHMGLFIHRDDSSNIFRFDMMANNIHNRGYIQAGNSEYSSIGTFFGAHSAQSAGGVVSLTSSSSATKYIALSGTTCSSPDCAGVTNPSTNFSTFDAGNLSNLNTYLTDSTNGVLSFTNASPASFFPQ